MTVYDYTDDQIEQILLVDPGHNAHVWCASAYFQATACIYPQQKSGWL